MANSLVSVTFDTNEAGSFVTPRVFGPDSTSSLYRVKQYIIGLMAGTYNGGAFAVTAGGLGSSSVLTYTGQPSDADTVTINGVVLTAKTTVGDEETEYEIGSTATDTYANLVTLVNSLTSSKLLKQTVRASQVVTTSSAGTVTFYSRIPGTVGNGSGGLFTAAESSSNATIAAFSGGTDDTVSTGTL